MQAVPCRQRLPACLKVCSSRALGWTLFISQVQECMPQAGFRGSQLMQHRQLGASHEEGHARSRFRGRSPSGGPICVPGGMCHVKDLLLCWTGVCVSATHSSPFNAQSGASDHDLVGLL